MGFPFLISWYYTLQTQNMIYIADRAKIVRIERGLSLPKRTSVHPLAFRGPRGGMYPEMGRKVKLSLQAFGPSTASSGK
jgi:hypothetical protein